MSALRHSIIAFPAARLACLAFLTCACFVAPRVFAQDEAATTAPAVDESRLSDRQIILRDRMTRLEDRMYQLSQAIARSEPEKSAQLLQSLGAARGMLLRQRMEEIARKLDDAQYADAADGQKELAADLNELLRMLLEGPDQLEERRKEIERLEALAKELDEVIRKQREAQFDARAAEGKPGQSLSEAAAALEKMIERQAKMRADSARQDADVQRLAEAQADLAAEARNLAESLQDEGRQNDAAAAGALRAAAEPLESAAERMEDAEQELRQGDAPGAKAPQEEAEEQLAEALKHLKEEMQREVERRRKESPLEGQSDKQKSITEKTRKLGSRMKASEESGGSKQSDKGQSGEGQPRESDGAQGSGEQQEKQGEQQEQEGERQGPVPGEREVQEAVPFQEQAEEQLESKEPEKAAESQGKALDRLEQARRELDKTLEQLRKEQQEELLAALEGRFKAMLARQLEINKGTQRLDELGQSQWQRADQLELADHAQKQLWVSEEADKALYILKEEGTTVVFPQIVEHLREDAAEAARLLSAANTGATTRAIQESIATTLKELIEAIEQKQAENEEGGSGEGQPSDPNQSQPLLPASAELKLLRSCQIRVNHSTEQLYKEGVEGESAAEADAMRQRRADLARRQAQVEEMARSMHEALRQAQ